MESGSIENLIILSLIMYFLYLMYRMITHKDVVRNDVHSNMEKYRQEMLNEGNK